MRSSFCLLVNLNLCFTYINLIKKPPETKNKREFLIHYKIVDEKSNNTIGYIGVINNRTNGKNNDLMFIKVKKEGYSLTEFEELYRILLNYVLSKYYNEYYYSNSNLQIIISYKDYKYHKIILNILLDSNFKIITTNINTTTKSIKQTIKHTSSRNNKQNRKTKNSSDKKVVDTKTY